MLEVLSIITMITFMAAGIVLMVTCFKWMRAANRIEKAFDDMQEAQDGEEGEESNA